MHLSLSLSLSLSKAAISQGATLLFYQVTPQALDPHQRLWIYSLMSCATGRSMLVHPPLKTVTDICESLHWQQHVKHVHTEAFGFFFASPMCLFHGLFALHEFSPIPTSGSLGDFCVKITNHAPHSGPSWHLF